MTALEQFRLDNNLKQTDISDYLGLSTTSYISRVELGHQKLPLKHLIRLLDNDKGWDTSALEQDEDTPSISPIPSASKAIGAQNMAEKNETIARLIAENESLKLRLEIMTEERDRCWKIITDTLKLK